MQKCGAKVVQLCEVHNYLLLFFDQNMFFIPFY